MTENPDKFKILVQESLRRQYQAIDTLASRGMIFWDYGNAFLLECCRAFDAVNQHSSIHDLNQTNNGGSSASVGSSKTRFKYPSYMQDVMGDIFSLGFGPFRWICTSDDIEDLRLTDRAATECFENILKSTDCKFKK